MGELCPEIVENNERNMRILFIRGAFLNKFEGQNYEQLTEDHQIIGIGSLTSIDKNFDFPVRLFFSPYDVSNKIERIGQIGLIGGRLARGLFNRFLGDSHFLFGLEKFVRGQRRSWDIAHIAETYYGYDLQVVRLKKYRFIKKIISTCWETIPFNNETIEKKKRIKEIVKKNVDLFICPTKRAQRALIEEGVNEERIRLLRMGVDLKRFKIPNSKFQIPNKFRVQNSKLKSFTLLFVGRLVKEKGVMEIYKAFKQIKNQKSKIKNHNVKLKIVGGGYLERKLLRKAKRDGLEKSIFIEKKSYQEMPKVYQEADLLIVPSKTTKTWEEQYGMVLVEAMASGLPIIAYRSGAIAEVLGDVGLLIDEGDINGLTKAIVNLINNKDLRIKLGSMGRKRAEKEFDREKIGKKIEEIYRNR